MSARETRHWPAFSGSADALCGDQARTCFFASDAADVTCAKCEAASYLPGPPVAMGRAISRALAVQAQA